MVPKCPTHIKSSELVMNEISILKTILKQRRYNNKKQLETTRGIKYERLVRHRKSVSRRPPHFINGKHSCIGVKKRQKIYNFATKFTPRLFMVALVASLPATQTSADTAKGSTGDQLVNVNKATS